METPKSRIKWIVGLIALVLFVLVVRTTTAYSASSPDLKASSNGAQLGNVGLSGSILRAGTSVFASVAAGISQGNSWLSHMTSTSKSFESTILILFGAGFLVLAFLVKRLRTSAPEI